MLAEFYQPDEGSLLVDGVEIRRYHPADLRTGVGYLSQYPELFAGFIRDNIILGRPGVSEQELSEVVRLTGVDTFTSADPQGLSREVGERGRALSSGQRQAIALARLLIRKPRVLFLDEPSNAMDTTTEALLIKRLLDLRKGTQTLIVCTHRHSMLKLVDRLIVIDAGKIVADRLSEEVLARLQGQQAPKRQAKRNNAGQDYDWPQRLRICQRCEGSA